MPHMSEKEWAQFAATKNLDPATGSKQQEQSDDAALWEADIRTILNRLRQLSDAQARMQTTIITGFVVMIALRFL